MLPETLQQQRVKNDMAAMGLFFCSSCLADKLTGLVVVMPQKGRLQWSIHNERATHVSFIVPLPDVATVIVV